MKFHSGPIDQRALFAKSPLDLIARVHKVLSAMNLEVTPTPDQFKIKVLKKMNGSTQGSPNSNKKSSSKKTGWAISAFPTEIVQRIKYMGIFGLQYNRGYDGSKEPPKHQAVTDEPIKMYVMVHQIKNLDGLLVVDLKRVRGDIWEFKRLYHEFITRLELYQGP